MTLAHDLHRVTTLDQLEALFGEVNEASRKKEVGYLHPLYQAWIAASPFALLATAGPTGLDVSPRGDPPGFVAAEDAHTLLLPEQRGNNRIDNLRNIVLDPRVALLLLIPGVGETLRVNGREHHDRTRRAGAFRDGRQAPQMRRGRCDRQRLLPMCARSSAQNCGSRSQLTC